MNFIYSQPSLRLGTEGNSGNQFLAGLKIVLHVIKVYSINRLYRAFDVCQSLKGYRSGTERRILMEQIVFERLKCILFIHGIILVSWL